MSTLPGNSKFKLRVEFSILQVTNIASIIICAQVADSVLVYIFKKACGVSFTDGWICVQQEHTSSSPFSDTYMFFTFGLDVSNLPTIGTASGISKIMGNVMFNYAYITTIPSWVNESDPKVNINKSIWKSTLISTLIFISIGIFGALAFKQISSSQDILSLINTSKEANIFSRLSVYFFPFIVLASTIPVFSIIVRYNLMQNKLMTKKLANFLAIVLPWIIVIPFATGNWLNQISNWATISMETLDWEENQVPEEPDGFRGLPVSKKNSIRIAKVSLISLSILIPVVIFFNFFYPDDN
eukprot:gene2447-3022_t